MKLVRYIDSCFQSDRDDSKSVSGFVFILNRGAVCWKSFKQTIIADLVCKVEYIAALDVAKEVIWLQKFLGELGVAPFLDWPVQCFVIALEPLLKISS